MTHAENDTQRSDLADQLGSLLRANVKVDRLQQKSLGATTVSIADIRYSRDSSNSKIRGRQTVAVLYEPDLALPKFGLSPPTTGLLGKIHGLIGDVGKIEFDDVAEFDEQYRLTGLAGEATRLLFNTTLRQQLAANPGWSLQGDGHRLAVFRQDQIVAEADTEDFIADSLAILAQLQQAEEMLDRHPNLSRSATPRDITAAAEQMNGIAGSMFRRVLDQFGSREEDVEALVDSAVPRNIPKSVAKQVVGNNLPVFFMGLLFIVVGIAVGGSLAVFGDGTEQMVGAMFLFGFPSIGAAMSVLVMRHRIRKYRLLRDGILCPGTIANIQNPSRPGSEGAHHTIEVKYQNAGEGLNLRKDVNGMIVTQAENLIASGKPARVLVDPVDSSHALCLDLLFIVS